VAEDNPKTAEKGVVDICS